MRAAIVTMGCKVNQAESADLALKLGEAGFTLAEPKECDLVVLNTCSVTARAESEAKSLLRRLRRQNPKAKVLAVGCLANLNQESITGPDLADAAAPFAEFDRLLDLAPIAVFPFNPPKNHLASASRTRALVKIQDGCSSRCSYCVVPLAKGPSRSVPPDMAILKLKEFFELGGKEAVLVGINLGSYGLDLGTDLGKFLELAGKSLPDDGSWRLRLSSIEPFETPYAYEALKKGWLAPHVHAPLQSGSDPVLRRMGRPYTRDDYRMVAYALVEKTGAIALGTDVMVGFPGETEGDFRNTRDLIEELPFSYLHVFPYSPRPGTAAATWPGQIPEKVKKERAMALKELDLIKRAKFLKDQISSKQLALVENSLDQKGRVRLLTGTYLRPAWAKSGEKPPPSNTFVSIRLSAPPNGDTVPEASPWRD
jgi:threonylcarbamoyladenosine tRNA methylthiotransferase MtaB